MRQKTSQNYRSKTGIGVQMITRGPNGPVNAHLVSWPSKAQNIQNLEIYGKEMTLTRWPGG